jgi:septal ring factor EnvC (AmiA/AmiB activator)
MVSRHTFYTVIFFHVLVLFICKPAASQTDVSDENTLLNEKSLNKKKEELQKIKEEISNLELELKSKAIKEKKTNSVLENFSKQNFLLNRLINKLLKEEQKKQKQITNIKNDINSLEREIKSIQDNYAKYVVVVYKSGKNSEWADIFNSNSVRQALLRYKYLSEFSDRRQKNLSELKEKKRKLDAQRVALKNEIAEKELFTKQKQQEKILLGKKLKERKKILNVIKNDKNELANELKLKKDSEAKIKDIINKLIEQADLKRNTYADISGSQDKVHDFQTQKLTAAESAFHSEVFSFASLKGKLNWPVAKGRIINNFGENRNKILNTVTINYGIDIRTDDDIDVKAVADGIVSAVEWIPGYGSVIILTHNEDYRTVYGHLSEIFVQEDDRIKKEEIIANVGEDLEGRILHFEIWNSRVNQDPEIWLAKK